MELNRNYLIGLALFSFGSCKTVKPYHRVYLNDNAMQINQKNVDKLSSSVHTYKEDASGGGRGKTSGGCGCN
jgi:uncharacterized membrane protein